MKEEEILKYFPRKIANFIQNTCCNIQGNLEEIRIRTGKQIILQFDTQEILVNTIITREDMAQIVQYLCENSIYSYQNQICCGYITLPKGHRVGITGEGISKDGKLININYISGINLRIAREIIGASNNFLKYILDVRQNSIFNTLIVSPPGAGKTTLIRDLIRNISDGNPFMQLKGITVGLVDERGEIAAMYKGIAQNNIGIRTDVINNVPKSIGMSMLVRSMCPKVIAADEIGSKEDVEAIQYAMCCGVKGIFTAHGKNVEDLVLNPAIKKLIEQYTFERILFLSKEKRGKPEVVYSRNIEKERYDILE